MARKCGTMPLHMTSPPGIHGLELSVVGHIRISGFKVADNIHVVNWIEIQETRGVWGGAIIMVCWSGEEELSLVWRKVMVVYWSGDE